MTNPDESWHECEEELKRERRAREAAEAELRETVGELERVTGLARATAEALDKALVKCTDRGTRLTEATTLLADWRRVSFAHPSELIVRTDAFLASRAPAEAAAPTPDEYPCKMGGECYCVPLCGTPKHRPVTLVSAPSPGAGEKRGPEQCDVRNMPKTLCDELTARGNGPGAGEKT